MRSTAAILALILTLCLTCRMEASGPEPLEGQLLAHDPSCIVRCDGLYYLFCTGQGIQSKTSPDRIHWTRGERVFASLPSWTTNTVANFRGHFWAPDLIRVGDKYLLYYSVSSWGSQTSAIGLATTSTLSTNAPQPRWEDQGIVIRSGQGQPYNAIDPSVCLDRNGSLWMAFGSFFGGLFVTQLDPSTGKRITPDSPVTRVAYHRAIEAACLVQHGGFYYLFVNWGNCCRGLRSTYEIRVGRSREAAGPFLDQEGRSLEDEGGTLFLTTTGPYVGPGHVGILEEDGECWFSYHYYDANDRGVSKLGLGKLSWTKDEWPTFHHTWSALYPFQLDARDTAENQHGTLEGGASLGEDANHGRVLLLTGTNSSVRLPPGVANARMFAGWVRWDGGPVGQPILQLNASSTNYARLVISTPQGGLRFTITTNGVSGEKTIDAEGILSIGVWTQVAITADGHQGVLYASGKPVATNPGMTVTPIELHADRNILGRRVSAESPPFQGAMRLVRFQSAPLNPESMLELSREAPIRNGTRENSPEGETR